MINLFEFERAAAEKLGSAAFDYYAGGAADRITLQDNVAAFQRIRLLPRVMVDVAARDHRTTMMGQELAAPLLIAPMAFQMLAHPDGELATARAAGAAGIPMVLSSLSTVAMEEVVAATSSPVWFQLYVFRDREVTRELVERAERAGCRALVVTVDAPVQGKREHDIRNRFHLPAGIEMKNLLPVQKAHLPITTEGSGLASFINSQFDPSLSWRDIEWLQGCTSLPILVKGILRSEDAAAAVSSGATGVIVSNHGGRQLDTAIASIDALPAIAERVADAATILLDGGVRRGTDVLKALALGARGVLIGRPVLWGLAVSGDSGVSQVLDLIREEFDIAMGLCGCRSVAEIDGELIARHRSC